MLEPTSLQALDDACLDAWRLGAIDTCRSAATALIEQAGDTGDPRLQARGWLHRARCDRLRADHPAALDAARRAAVLLEGVPGHGAAGKRIRAQAIACAAAAALGRHDEAIEAGLQACHLAGEAGDAPQDARQAADALAQALGWSGQFDEALRAADRALDHARASGQPAAVRRQMAHRTGLLAWQAIHQDARDPDGPVGRALAASIDEALMLGEPAHGHGGRTDRFVLGWAQVLLTCWRGEPERARVQLAAIRPLAQAGTPWLDLFAVWAAAEIAWRQRAWPAAEASARRVFDEAHRLTHDALAERGAHLLARILVDLGRSAQALEVLQSCRQRREAARLRDLPARAELAAFLAQARARAASPGRTLLPPDDPLTGLADRTRFLQRAQESLQGLEPARMRCAVVLVAIEATHDMAERHAPLVRDRVLCAVAGLLRRALRAGDLPARWTHDEFAVLLHRASAHDTDRVCRRLAQAVMDHDWSLLTAGLQVRVAISHAQARAGDGIEPLMARCEDEMRRGRLAQPAAA